VGVKAWPPAAIVNLLGLFRRRALLRSLGVKPLEYETTVVTEELMHANHPQR
jgi:hypothetical protein